MNGLAPALEVMASKGYTAQHCLKGTGLLSKQLQNPNLSVTLNQEIAFYRNALALSEDPCIGLEIGAAFLPQRHGLMGYALMSASTLRQALTLACKFGDLTFSWFDLVFTVTGNTACFALIDRVDIDPAIANLLRDRDCAAVWAACSELLRQPLHLDQVALPHDGHRREANYRHHFACEIAFGSNPARLEFAASQLDTPLPSRDPAACDHLHQQCQLLLSKLSRQDFLVNDLRQLLLARPGYFPDIEMLAEKLGMSVRTLRRRLADEGASYQAVLDEVRFGLARKYLLETHLPVQEIAPLLGFSDPGNFTHAFKRWAGCPPNVFRLQKDSDPT
ncbi:AraC family transcriptional regulator [Pseudomonas jessenii]|uniref:AraC family transcriptional regulator n=1 Tax=Pseudomonas jessenii TaxID=77298 RepID=UPI00389275BE